MSFLEGIGKFGEKVGETVAKSAGNARDKSKIIMEKQKLKNKQNKIESQMNANLLELGKRYYDLCCELPVDDVQELVNAIAQAKNDIAQIEAEIKALSPNSYCINCGKELRKDQLYCDVCGTKQPVAEKPEPEVVSGDVINADGEQIAAAEDTANTAAPVENAEETVKEEKSE